MLFTHVVTYSSCFKEAHCGHLLGARGANDLAWIFEFQYSRERERGRESETDFKKARRGHPRQQHAKIVLLIVHTS